MNIADQYAYYLISGRRLKRLLDVVLSIAILLAASIPMLLVAILIKLTSKGPIFFRQTRVGFQGRSFEILKFRTMVHGTDDWRSHLTKEQQDEYQKRFKLENDPRVTRLGKLLRNSSMDELPQLLNVLKGDMSLVGPRPITMDELQLFGPFTEQLISVKPGITCISQVSGRSSITLNERIGYDMEYVKRSCVILDVCILCKTIMVVLLRRGAM